MLPALVGIYCPKEAIAGLPLCVFSAKKNRRSMEEQWGGICLCKTNQ